VSNAGDWLYSVALVVLVFERTGSSAWVAAATVSRLLAFVLLGPVGGAVADRFDRRRLMVTLDLVRAGLMAVLTVVAVVDGPVLLALVIATLTSAASLPYRPAVVAVTPELVGEDDLAAGNAAEAIVSRAAAFVGPALGAALVAASSPSVAFLVNALTFGVSALLVVRLGNLGGRSASPGAVQPSFATDVVDGVRAVASNRGLVALLLFVMAATFLFGFEMVAQVLVAEQRLGLGASAVGLLSAAIGVGGLLVVPFSARLGGGRWSGLLLAGSGMLIALPVITLAVVSTPLAAMGVLLVEGVGVILLEVMFVTLLQRSCPDELLGRVYSLMDSGTAATQLLGALAVPLLVGTFGIEWALVCGGAVLVAGSLGSAPSLHRLGLRAEAQRLRLAPVVVRLRGLGILGDASVAALERIARSASPVAVTAGEAIVNEGDDADSFYVITGGEFRVERAGVGELATLGPDEWFGEVGLLHRTPRNATVRATSDGEVLAVPGSLFLEALAATEMLPDPLHRTLTARAVAERSQLAGDRAA